jgi:magnesium-transporting ATPase (P-type)
MQASAAMAAFFFVLRGGGWRYGVLPGAHDPLYLQATSACFGAIVVMQIVNVFLCRSERESMFGAGWLGNRLIGIGIAVEVALLVAIVYTPVGNVLFDTAPVAWSVWIFAAPFALGMIAIEELRKWIVRRRPSAHPQR